MIKYSILILLFVFNGLLCFSQQTFETFIDFKLNNVSSGEYGYRFENVNDSTSILVSQIVNNSEIDTFNNLSAFIVFYKFKHNGSITDTIIFRKKKYRLEPMSFIELNNNYYLLTQTIDYVAKENINQGRYLELYKLNKDFDTIWSKQIKFNNNEHFTKKIIALDSNKIAVVGTYYKDTSAKYDIFYKLFDTLGNNILTNTYSYTSNSYEVFSSITKSKNYLYVWGSTFIPGKSQEGFILQLDFNGNLINKNLIGDTVERINIFSAGNIDLVDDNKLIVCGTNLSIIDLNYRGIFYVVDSNLNFKVIGNYNKYHNRFTEIQYQRNRYYILGLQFEGPSEQQSSGLLLCYDTSGTFLWDRNYNYSTSYKDLVPYSFLYQDGYIYMTGFGSYYDPFNNSIQDTWLIKTDSLGCLIGGCNTTFVDLKTNNIRIYPNPANDFLTVLSDEKLNDVKFRIIDFTGKVLLNGTLQNEKIDLLNINSGLYLLELKSNSNNIIHMKFVKE